jgi:hypothetical protein
MKAFVLKLKIYIINGIFRDGSEMKNVRQLSPDFLEVA